MVEVIELDYVILGRVLKKARENSKRTQKEVADLLGVTAQNVSSWELGKSKIDIETYVKICCVYHIDTRIPLSKASENLLVYSFPDYGPDVDSLDKRIIETYLALDVAQRKSIKSYLRSLVDAVLSDENYDEYREEYVKENAGTVAARGGHSEQIGELKNLYDNGDIDSEKK